MKNKYIMYKVQDYTWYFVNAFNSCIFSYECKWTSDCIFKIKNQLLVLKLVPFINSYLLDSFCFPLPEHFLCIINCFDHAHITSRL